MERPANAASRRADMPEGTHAILNTRALHTAYRHLAEILGPGMTVLDVGCGTGAITRGMAEAVTPNGRVVGVDVNARLIDEARLTHGTVAGLAFDVCDVHRLPYRSAFDVVSGARCLQWLAAPLSALQHMAAALKPGGRLAVLDYNHEKIAWHPLLLRVCRPSTGPSCNGAVKPAWTMPSPITYPPCSRASDWWTSS